MSATQTGTHTRIHPHLEPNNSHLPLPPLQLSLEVSLVLESGTT